MRQREQITFPIRTYLAKKGIDFVAQPVTRIDADNNFLEFLAIAFSPLRLHDAPAAEAMVYRNVARQLADRLDSLEN